MAYLYRHIRLDKNEPFYIGIGSDSNYRRAYRKDSRNKYWTNIVNKSNYKIEIVLDDLSWDDACKKEIEFIKLYGRRDLNKGILVNMTDGGEGTIGKILSDETKSKISKKVKENSHWKSNKKHTLETKLKISEFNCKPIINIISKEIFKSINDAAKSANITPNTLARKLAGIRNNNTNFRYYGNI